MSQHAKTAISRSRWALLLCAAWGSAAFARPVLALEPTGKGQTPGQAAAPDRPRTDLRVDMAMGYHFTPLVDGQVTALGGYFNGSKTVRLFDATTGTLLASATVTPVGTWSYAAIAPVPLRAGSLYTVAVYLAGAGGSLAPVLRPRLPLTVGDIRIESATSISTKDQPAARPINRRTTQLSGQADIRFVPMAASLPKGSAVILPKGSVVINGGAALTNALAVTLTLHAGAAKAAAAATQVQCSNDGLAYSPPEPLEAARVWTLTPGDGKKTVYVKFGDGSRWSAPAADSITLDTKPPRVSITSPSDGTVITTLGGS